MKSYSKKVLSAILEVWIRLMLPIKPLKALSWSLSYRSTCLWAILPVIRQSNVEPGVLRVSEMGGFPGSCRRGLRQRKSR